MTRDLLLPEALRAEVVRALYADANQLGWATLGPQAKTVAFNRWVEDARVGGRFDAIALFAEGGFGVSMMSSNVLDKVMITKPGKPFSATVHAGVGVEYQIWNRHYAFGLAVDGFLEPEFDGMKALDSRLYVRYTYGGG